MELPAPDEKQPFNLGVGQAILETGFQMLHPDEELLPHWEFFRGNVEVILSGKPFCADNLPLLRQMIESVRGESLEADKMLGGMKLSLSAVLLASLNPYTVNAKDRPLWHNDIDALLRRAGATVHESLVADPFEGEITLDLDSAADANKEHRERWMRQLIDTAWRPPE